MTGLRPENHELGLGSVDATLDNLLVKVCNLPQIEIKHTCWPEQIESGYGLLMYFK